MCLEIIIFLSFAVTLYQGKKNEIIWCMDGIENIGNIGELYGGYLRLA